MRRSPRLTLLPLLLIATGCSPSIGPTVLSIDPAEYLNAFAAAVDVADDHGLVTAVQDRRSGIIETRPAAAPTLIDPWTAKGESLPQLSENTISQQRRRARFEFTTGGFDPADAPDGLPGPDLLAEEDPPTDLTVTERPIELRVWVYIDRVHHPGVRHGTWTFSKNIWSRVVVSEDGERRVLSTTWTTVTRDESLERRMLAEVRARLAATSGTPEENPDAS